MVCGGIMFGMYMPERSRRKEIREMGVSAMAFIICILSSLSFSTLETPYPNRELKPGTGKMPKFRVLLLPIFTNTQTDYEKKRTVYEKIPKNEKTVV